MNHLCVHGSTECLGVTLVTQESRNRPVVADECFGNLVQCFGRHPGLDVPGQFGQCLRNEEVALTHQLNLVRCFY